MRGHAYFTLRERGAMGVSIGQVVAHLYPPAPKPGKASLHGWEANEVGEGGRMKRIGKEEEVI